MTADWSVPDPAEATGNEAEVRYAFADTLRMLTNRINVFVSLPLQSLDQLTLQKRLDSIGKTKGVNCRFCVGRIMIDIMSAARVAVRAAIAGPRRCIHTPLSHSITCSLK